MKITLEPESEEEEKSMPDGPLCLAGVVAYGLVGWTSPIPNAFTPICLSRCSRDDLLELLLRIEKLRRSVELLIDG